MPTILNNSELHTMSQSTLPKAILFDHDGTLINSEAVHFKLWQQTLKPYEVSLTDAYYNEIMANF